MGNKLEFLFSLVVEKVTTLKKKHGDNFNSENFFIGLGKILDSNVVASGGWKKIAKDLVENIMSMPEYTIDGYGNKKLVRSHHYLIEQVRIPACQKPGILEILRVALNIGEFLGVEDKVLYNDITYNLLKLDNLTRYILKADIQEISNKITNKQIEDLRIYFDNQV